MGWTYLEHHIGIRDLRYSREIEHYSQKKDKTRDCKVHPLHVLQRSSTITNVLEEGVGSEDRRNDSPDSIEGLREVDAYLRIPGWTTHYVREITISQSVDCYAREED